MTITPSSVEWETQMNERLEKEDATLVAIAFHCLSHVADDRQMG
jgi:hypothetical protein